MSGQFRLQNVTLAWNFSQIGGYTAIKTDLYQILDMVRYPFKYCQYNVRIPRGILFHGPPGNGKTLFARCFAGESQLPIIATSGSEFQEKYVGTGPARIRELFDFAREHAPCILFIDEIDAVARRRGTDQEAAQAERDSTLNQLLVELDGFHDHRNDSQFVFVIASTNRLDILDPALLRPGRMDKKIRVPLPDAPTRRAIINIHRQGKPLDVSLEWLVHEMTEGCSGAEIEHLLNEATLVGIRKNQLPIPQQVVEETAESILLGGHLDHDDDAGRRTSFPPPPDRTTSHRELERVAIHEVGHSLMAFLCTHHAPPKKCSLRNCPAMNMLGFTLFPRQMQQQLMTSQELEDRIKVLLAGRIAEELL
nr:AAA family ATPase [Candidatus Sigynarchaeota archaeon]